MPRISIRGPMSAAVLTACGLALRTSAAAVAPTPLDIEVDENGFGSLTTDVSGISVTVPLVSGTQADPGPGGLSSALTYDLGTISPNPGDVFLVEPGSTAFSDLIRFNAAAAGRPIGSPNALVFYSDNGDGVDALADTGLPTAFYSSTAVINEVGPEGNNGADYTPTANQPGFVPNFAATYHFISDLPEPSISGLVFCGALMLARRRRKLLNDSNDSEPLSSGGTV